MPSTPSGGVLAFSRGSAFRITNPNPSQPRGFKVHICGSHLVLVAKAGVKDITHEAILAGTNSMAPVNMLRMARLSLMIRVVSEKSKNLHLLSILYAAKGSKKSWLFAVQDDVRFLSKFDVFSELLDAPFQTWCKMFREEPKATKAAIKKVFLSSEANTKLIWAVTKQLQATELEFPCSICGLIFS